MLFSLVFSSVVAQFKALSVNHELGCTGHITSSLLTKSESCQAINCSLGVTTTCPTSFSDFQSGLDAKSPYFLLGVYSDDCTDDKLSTGVALLADSTCVFFNATTSFKATIKNGAVTF